MKYFFVPGLCAIALALPLAAFSQAACSSDGLTAPTALMERFINADCAGCWADNAAPRPVARTLALDWIVPSPKGDDAALSAAAIQDSYWRLEALRYAAPASTDTVRSPGRAATGRLRVAHGQAFNGYIGTSIALRPPGSWVRKPVTAWVVLIETIPAGVEGTVVERNLVRNALQVEPGVLRAAKRGAGWIETRPMSIPEGARPDRLRVAGWVEDAAGRVGAIALSSCRLAK